MNVPISRYVSVIFIAAMVGIAAQIVVLVAVAAVTYPNALMFAIGAVRLCGLLALSTAALFGFMYATNVRLRQALSRRQATVAFAIAGAIGPSIPYLHSCTGRLTRCFVENAWDAILGPGTILSGAVLALVFLTICRQLLNPQRDAT